jgi:hypothetical protein
VELQRKSGKVYMMMETVVYSREYLFVKQLYDSGRTRPHSVSPRKPSAGHGGMAWLLGGLPTDALRDPLRQSVSCAVGKHANTWSVMGPAASTRR